jgi:hypothetical protein
MLSSISFTPSPQVVRWRKERTARVNRLLRFRFSDLWRARHGGCSFISDDDEGRTMLMVLLRVRTTAESAMESAPWLSERELKALRKAGRKMPWNKIGELLKLTDAERTAHKLWYWPPIDVPWEEVRRRQSQRNTEKERERKRKQRAKEREARDMLNHTRGRPLAILLMLGGADAPPPRPRGITLPPPPTFPPTPDGWTAVSALVKRAETVRAFRRPDGWSVSRDSLRVLVHRTLEQMRDDGMIDTKIVKGVHGDVCLVRLVDVNMTAEMAPHADAFCYRNSVTGVVEAETVGRPTASAEKAASEAASGSVIGRADARRYVPEARARSAPNGNGKSNGEHVARRERRPPTEEGTSAQPLAAATPRPSRVHHLTAVGIG